MIEGWIGFEQLHRRGRRGTVDAGNPTRLVPASQHGRWKMDSRCLLWTRGRTVTPDQEVVDLKPCTM